MLEINVRDIDGYKFYLTMIDIKRLYRRWFNIGEYCVPILICKSIHIIIGPCYSKIEILQ